MAEWKDQVTQATTGYKTKLLSIFQAKLDSETQSLREQLSNKDSQIEKLNQEITVLKSEKQNLENRFQEINQQAQAGIVSMEELELELENLKQNPPHPDMIELSEKGVAERRQRRQDNLDQILTILQEKGESSKSFLQKELIVSENTVSGYLTELVNSGKVARIGQGSATIYKLAQITQ